MKIFKGNNKYFIIGGLILAFLAYKFIGPKLLGRNGGNGGMGPMPMGPMPDALPTESTAPSSAPLGLGGEPGFVSGGGLGTYRQSAPGPQFMQSTMPLTQIRSARVRVV